MLILIAVGENATALYDEPDGGVCLVGILDTDDSRNQSVCHIVKNGPLLRIGGRTLKCGGH